VSAERVVVTRTEMRKILDSIKEIQRIVDGILERPEPGPVEKTDRGWPIFGTGSGVVELPDDDN
jgi:hypothetical protein